MPESEAQLIVLHRGVPVGVATLTRIRPGREDLRLRPPRVFAGAVRPALQAASDALALAGEAPLPEAATFRPLAGYAAVREVVRHAGEAFQRMGYLGPPSEPTSAARGEAALAAAEALWGELELHDERGLPVPGRVVWMLELLLAAAPLYWIVLSFEGSPASVPAWPHPPAGYASGDEPPAT